MNGTSKSSFWSKARKIFGFLLKFAIASAAVWFLLLRNPQALKTSLTGFSLFWLIPAGTAYCFHMLVVGWRWKKLTSILGVELPGAEAYSLTFQGYFFSLVIPGGAIGGDVVKMGVFSKRTKAGAKAEGAFTILMDRIVGMISLFLLTLALLPFAVPLLMQVEVPGVHHSLNPALIAAFALLCLAGLGASCIIFFHQAIRKVGFLDKWMQTADRISHGLLFRMTAATDVYARHWKDLSLLVLIGIFLVIIMTVFPLFFLFAGMGVRYSVFAVIVALTIGNIVGLLPFLPAGVGGRDLVTVMILTASGIPADRGTCAMLIYTMILLFFNLLGGVFFVFDSGRKQETVKNGES